jgi:hypothetical protein
MEALQHPATLESFIVNEWIRMAINAMDGNVGNFVACDNHESSTLSTVHWAADDPVHLIGRQAKDATHRSRQPFVSHPSVLITFYRLEP